MADVVRDGLLLPLFSTAVPSLLLPDALRIGQGQTSAAAGAEPTKREVRIAKRSLCIYCPDIFLSLVHRRRTAAAAGPLCRCVVDLGAAQDGHDDGRGLPVRAAYPQH